MDDNPGLRIGRIAGVPVYVAPSWFAVAVVIVLLFAPQVQAATALGSTAALAVAAGYALLLLLSVLVHEAAHAIAARRFGFPVHQVVANLWGGHTTFTDSTSSPARSAVVAVVGPLANALLAVAGLLALPSLGAGVSRLLITAFVYTNVFVTLFNLAPGLPLDGGRVVECLVWRLSGQRWKGTLAAGWCGRVVAVVLVAVAVVWPLLRADRPRIATAVWAALIAIMLWRGASEAITSAGLWRRAAALDLRQFLQPARAMRLDTDGWREVIERREHVVAVDEAGRAVGLLRVEGTGWPPAPPLPSAPAGTPLSAVMQVATPLVMPLDATGERVLTELAGSGASVAVALDDAGRVVGIADTEPLAAALTGRR